MAKRSVAAALAVLAVIGIAMAAEEPGAATLLASGERVTREIVPRDIHAFMVTLAEGRHARVVVDQTGADVALRALGPDGVGTAAMDAPSGSHQPERMTVIAGRGGVYRIEVRSLRSNQSAGPYSIVVEDAGCATDADRKRAAAERIFMEGEALREAAGAENLRKAAAKFEEAHALWSAIGDDVMAGDASQHAGFVMDLLDDFPTATRHYEAALAQRRASGDIRREAETLSNLGAIHRVTGNLARAVETLDQALVLRRKAGDRRGEASTLHNLGTAYWNRSDYTKAAVYYGEALAIRRATGDRKGEAESLTGLGVTARVTGQSQKAIEYYSEALAIRREANDRRGTATTLHNLGVAYSSLGAFRKAIDQYTESLALSRAEGNRVFESAALTSTGVAWNFLGEYKKALDAFREALVVKRSVGDKRGEAEALSYSGLALEALGEPKSAVAMYLEALPLNREVSDRRGEAFTLSNLGSAYATLGDSEKATEYLEQALQLQRAIHDENSEAVTLMSIAMMERDRGQLEAARKRIETALEIVERTRSRVAAQNLRASYLALKQDHYKIYVDVLMRMHERNPPGGHDQEAFMAAEQGRSRVLRELLAEARAGLVKGIDPEMLRRREAIERDLSAKERERVRLGPRAPAEKRAAADRAVETLLAQYHGVEAEIRASNPRYAEVMQRAAPDLSAIQQLLDDDTVLLAYSLGKNRSFVWAVTRNSLRAVGLERALTIEKASRRFYDLLSSTPKREREPAFRAAGRDLSDLVLKPVAASLKPAKRLLIIGEGALQFVPFAALPSPASSSALVATHEIVVLPSASVMAVLRNDLSRERARGTIAVLADPVLRADDPRVTGHSRQQSGAIQPARSSGELGIDDFERLPSTRVEADAILALVGSEGALKATDFDASRDTAMSANLREYRYIHFATHGLINSLRPELSGVVLSLVDRDGRPRDGFLRLHDIYNLDLNADLVVLSACRTALGAQMRGEGLIGLSRGFMYAGAPRVLATLWDVRDNTTADFMKRFYEQMLKQNRSPAAALRAAQLSFVREGRPASYWASFVLQGEWR
jgi:CHAT domain-containing protein/tetratricopeptide (TPR) repeat protein